MEPTNPDGIASDIIAQTFKKYPESIIFSGGPPFNLVSALKEHPDLHFNLWVAQGGFAGDNLVPLEHRLAKFNGKETCVSANWMNTEAIDFLLSTPQISKRLVISKNVCHGISYDKNFHTQVQKVPKKSLGLELIYQGTFILMSFTQSRNGYLS